MSNAKGDGSKKLDVVTPFGRLNRHTGFYTSAKLRHVKTIIAKLIEDAQLEVLRALHDDAITFHQLVDADREGKLTGTRVLDAVRLRESLSAAIARCLKRMGRADPTRRRYATSLRKLERDTAIPMKNGKTLAGTQLSVGSLADIDWKAYERAPVWKSGADWNHLRRAVSAFLTVFFGTEHHQFRVQLIESIPLRAERSRIPTLSPSAFWRIVAAVPEHAQPCYVSLAASGMRLGEYLRTRAEDLVASECAIDVRGTKTDASADRIYVHEKLWPWIEGGVPSPLGERWMGIYWRRACLALGLAREIATGRTARRRVKRATSGPYRAGEQPEYREVEITRYAGPRLHDLRHLYAQIADEAGLTTETVMAGLRHTNPKQTSDYKRRAAAREVGTIVGRNLVAAMPSRRRAGTRRRAS
jgi:integrase